MWGEAGVMTVGKYFKTIDRGTTITLVGYAKCKGDTVKMCDSSTNRGVVIPGDYMVKTHAFQARKSDRSTRA
jgi:hypothetical protein